MAQIGTIRLKTGSGDVDIPVYEAGDSGASVDEFLRVETERGRGFIPVCDLSDAAYSFLRVQSSSRGVLAAHDSPRLTLLKEDFEDGSIKPDWDFYSTDSNGYDEDSTVAGELYVDFDTQKTTRVTWTGNDISSSAISLKAKVTHQSLNTGEGRPQSGIALMDSSGASNAIICQSTHDLDRGAAKEVSDTGGETVHQTISNSANPAYYRIDWEPSQNQVTFYIASNDPVNGSGSWNQFHSMTPSYSPKYCGIWGDDGDGSVDWFRIDPL
jgi:hypothetical protein